MVRDVINKRLFLLARFLKTSHNGNNAGRESTPRFANMIYPYLFKLFIQKIVFNILSMFNDFYFVKEL